MQTHSQHPTLDGVAHQKVAQQKPDDEAEVDVDNDPGNEDPGSQFDRDATVPLIDPDAD